MANREKWVAKMVDGQFLLIPAGQYVPESRHLPATGIITDTMDNLWHPCNGRYSNSKSQFRRWTKEAGCEEIGNERIKPRDNYKESGMQASVKGDLIRAYNDAERRFR